MTDADPPTSSEPATPIPTLAYATPGREERALPRDRIYDAFFLGVGATSAIAIWNLDGGWGGHNADWVVSLGVAQVIIFWLIVFFRGPRPISRQGQSVSIFFYGLITNVISVVTAEVVFTSFPSLLVTKRFIVLLMDVTLFLGPMVILTTLTAVGLLPRSPRGNSSSPIADP